jgi:hypothetical protein
MAFYQALLSFDMVASHPSGFTATVERKVKDIVEASDESAARTSFTNKYSGDHISNLKIDDVKQTAAVL